MSKKINKVDEKQIRDIVKEVLNIDNLTNIERMGGLTNRTFRVEGENTDSYVVRLPGEGTEEIINRSDEKISTELAGNVGIDAKLFYFGENTGIKVSEYITDSRTMHPQDMQKLENLVLAAEVLKRLHNSGIDTGVSFDVIDMAETYEKYIIENGGFFYEDYEEIKACINQIKANYLPTVTKKSCHNDPLCENWILQNDNKIYLIDWEYAGMNDPLWDLADVALEAELNSEQEEVLLKSYLGREIAEEEKEGFAINKVLIDYLWSLWGKTQAVHEGEEMEQYALERYQRMKRNMEQGIYSRCF